MIKLIEYAYDEKYGWARCLVGYKGMTFEGGAACHPEDKDFSNERVGLTIAEARANIKAMRFIRDYEIKVELNALKHLYSNIETSKNHNPKSHESRRIRSQIRALEHELEAINHDIEDEKQFIKDYIDGKDKLYKRLRAKNQ